MPPSFRDSAGIAFKQLSDIHQSETALTKTMNFFLDSIGTALSRQYYLRPIFVVGSGRSGTSVLRQALGQHPSIVAAPGSNAYEQWGEEQRTSFRIICGTTMQELGYPLPFLKD